MAKKFVKRYMPDAHKIRHHRHLRFFGTLLHDPNLWHLNRHSVAGAMAVGLFWAFVPIPLQMIPAAALAIWFRVNLPISVALVWLTNPITMPPVFYFNYKLGTWILRRPVEDVTFPVSDVKFELSWTWVTHEWAWITHEFGARRRRSDLAVSRQKINGVRPHLFSLTAGAAAQPPLHKRIRI